MYHNPHNNQQYFRIDNNDLDYLRTEHSMAIQDSKYVKIETNRERIFEHYLHSLKCKQQLGKQQINLMSNNKLNLRYCREEDVILKQWNFLLFKARYLAKTRLLIQNGRT